MRLSVLHFCLCPTGRAFDDEGNRIFWPTSTDSQIPNILYELDNSKIETMRANVYGNVFLSATPLKGLTLKSSFMPSIAYTRYGFYMGQLTKINVGKNPAYVNNIIHLTGHMCGTIPLIITPNSKAINSI